MMGLKMMPLILLASTSVLAGGSSSPWELACGKDIKINTLCVDVEAGGLIAGRASKIYPPNTFLEVWVRSNVDFEVKLTGERGLRESKLGDVAGFDSGAPRVVSTTFAPRKPGHLDLIVKDTSGKVLAKHELEVEERFWGAVRTGLSAAWIPGFRSFEVLQFPGSQTAQVSGSVQSMQFELVASFVPFLEMIWDKGRSYTSGAGVSNIVVAPTFGVGVVGQLNKELTALTSAHIGLEFEFASNFSVAVTAVFKRTKELKPGLGLGSPLQVGTQVADITVDGVAPGIAVTINASPDFFKFKLPGGL